MRKQPFLSPIPFFSSLSPLLRYIEDVSIIIPSARESGSLAYLQKPAGSIGGHSFGRVESRGGVGRLGRAEEKHGQPREARRVDSWPVATVR